MVFLEDDDYYKVPNFRQVDFFTNKNLDKNISLLKQSIHKINHLQDRNNNNERERNKNVNKAFSVNFN